MKEQAPGQRDSQEELPTSIANRKKTAGIVAGATVATGILITWLVHEANKAADKVEADRAAAALAEQEPTNAVRVLPQKHIEPLPVHEAPAEIETEVIGESQPLPGTFAHIPLSLDRRTLSQDDKIMIDGLEHDPYFYLDETNMKRIAELKITPPERLIALYRYRKIGGQLDRILFPNTFAENGAEFIDWCEKNSHPNVAKEQRTFMLVFKKLTEELEGQE